ncbi:MAG: hypothetical protein JW776_09275 [Candidatus Lokiarchaeota archaeon]|nr:hypothetical protein [Candidatus Lokiarchaeota archaeon]
MNKLGIKREDFRSSTLICPIMKDTCISENCKFWGNKECIILEQLIELPNVILEHFHRNSRKVGATSYREEESGDDDHENKIDDNTYDEEIDDDDGLEDIEEQEIMGLEEFEEDIEDLFDDEEDEEDEEDEDDEENKEEEEEKEGTMPSGKSMDEILELIEQMDPFPIREWEEEVPDYLKKSEEEITKALVEYCVRKKPDVVDWEELHFVREMFWEMHIKRPYLLPADYRMKVDEIEQLAKKMLIERKIPVFFWKMSVKELTKEILNESNSENNWLMIKPRGEFSVNGIPERYLPEELQEKIEIARRFAVDLIDEEFEDELRKRTKKLIPIFLRWCASKNVKKITRSCVDAFMFEEKKDYPDDARAYIQFIANLKISKK